MKDTEFMERAIELAARGEGWTAPNPMVGAVIVKEGKIIGEGWHQRWGEPHAERNALANARERAGAKASERLKGAVLYVTLEPCCHHGKTPPCTEAILEAGIARVVIGSKDPNPLVAGKGATTLREAGVVVEEGFLQEECDRLNPIFFHYITTGLPYLVMKYAMTADGKIAAVTGESKWITGEEARRDVQKLRHRFRGIMAGIQTVLKDDPLLTCRMPGGRNPVRIICDSFLRLPVDSAICQTAAEIPTIVAALDEKDAARLGGSGCLQDFREKRDALRGLGVQILEVPWDEEKGREKPAAGRAAVKLDPKSLMKKLGEQGIDSVLLEGGASLNYTMLSSGLVKKIYAYIAPKIFGGEGAKSPVGGKGVDFPSQAFLLSPPDIRRIGDDLRLEYEVRNNEICPREGAAGKEKRGCLPES